MARHVITTFLADTLNPMIRHHLDSFSDFLEKIPRFIQATNPFKRLLEDGREIRIFIGGKDGKIKYVTPVDEEGIAILPHACRLENKTYAFEIRANILVEYNYGDEVQSKMFEDILIGRIPLLLKSSLCYLRSMESEQLYDSGECRFELGGYFVITGQERVLLSQEYLGSNMFYAKKRIEGPSKEEKRSRSEKELKAIMETATKENKFEFLSGIYSESEDGTRRSGHLLVIPPENKSITDSSTISKTSDYGNFSTNRLATIHIIDFNRKNGFDNPVPLFSVFYALGFTSDQEIYDVVLAGVHEKTIYDTLFIQLVLSHEKYLASEMAKEEDQTQDANLLFLKRQTRTRSNGSVYTNLYSCLFPHCEFIEKESVSALYRRKAYLLGHMLKMAMDVSLGIIPDSDRDHFRYKRVDASGDLCFKEFRRIYNEVGAKMLLELDRRVEFEKQTYKGKNLTNLIQEEGIRNFYWKSYMFINEFEKSFKGKWDKEPGVAQVLSRFSYLGTISHLRRINLKMDKETKKREPRRLHSSSWGFMCPIDNPDGQNIGMIKSLSLFSKLSTYTPTSKLKEIIFNQPNVRSISAIHPTAWNPLWTKVFVNFDLVCVVMKDTETFHSTLIGERRSGNLNNYVSLTWNRLENEYLIQCDSGRPCRPIYREATKSSSIASSKSWKVIEKHMDYIDPQESECLRISMEPFHAENPSEIHGSTIFSATGSVMPFTDHNQAPRNMFTCQQVKQSCSWYNTAFNKRFDTIATHLHSPQKPLCQTWTASILGGGCIQFGENAIVAIAVYGGYNQEDSVLINNAALNRGMFETSYYHSYDESERMINPITLLHTMIANPATDPKYRETVSRKDGKNYDYLDSDGVIKVGSEVTDSTILLGLVTPKTNNLEQIIGFTDSSILPKRAQRGMVDSVYRYTTSEGLQGVKIRVVEIRHPVLGDKFGSRHGQKGTVGLLIAEEDMPTTKDGLRPDLIINPHALPSRMTIGQFLEGMSSKLAVDVGTIVDGTAFSTQQRIGDTKEALIQLGYHPYGNEILYNGMNGEMIESEIFMGPTYYQRFKHMVEDKINYRSTGPRTLLTHQPLEGRAQDGGLRIGEMERDSLVAHGISNFLQESMTLRSDAHEFLFQPDTGLLDVNPEYPTTVLPIPYSMGLFLNEIQSMHIQVKLSS
jgi:DNA-directed RNA polymerase II subunit RPB2